MSAKIQRDGIDLEVLDELGVHRGYAMVTERLRAVLAQAVADLEATPDWNQARFLQGQIRTLRLALGLPDLLVKEIRSKMNPATKGNR